MKGGLVFVFSWSYALYKQIAGSDLVKNVLQLLIDGNKHNKCVKWEKKYILVL